jgi:hypothetical protein
MNAFVATVQLTSYNDKCWAFNAEVLLGGVNHGLMISFITLTWATNAFMWLLYSWIFLGFKLTWLCIYLSIVVFCGTCLSGQHRLFQERINNETYRNSNKQSETRNSYQPAQLLQLPSRSLGLTLGLAPHCLLFCLLCSKLCQPSDAISGLG